MRRHAAIGTITAAVTVAALAGCTSEAGTTRPAPTAASSTVVEDHDVTVATTVTSSVHPQPAVPTSTHAVAAAAVNTIVLAVPPLPADLSPIRPTGPTTEPPDDHDHDHSDQAATPGDAAVAWVVALYTARFDDPDGLAAGEIAELADTVEIAAAAVAAIEPIDVEHSEARWPIVTGVSDAGNGTWRVEFVVKRTLVGQVGPSTSDPLHIDVTVVDGHVTAWTPVAVS